MLADKAGPVTRFTVGRGSGLCYRFTVGRGSKPGQTARNLHFLDFLDSSRARVESQESDSLPLLAQVAEVTKGGYVVMTRQKVVPLLTRAIPAESQEFRHLRAIPAIKSRTY